MSVNRSPFSFSLHLWPCRLEIALGACTIELMSVPSVNNIRAELDVLYTSQYLIRILFDIVFIFTMNNPRYEDTQRFTVG